MPITRFAKPEDLEQIMALYRFLVPDDFEADPQRLGEVWQDILDHQDRYRYIVTEEDGVILSTCNIAIVPNLTRAARPYAVIENVITHPDARRKGFGRATLMKAIEFAKEMGCYKVMLLSGSHRTEAHGFYESLGFSGTRKKGFVMEML